jgi:serine/threonine protein phosphatase PrpC
MMRDIFRGNKASWGVGELRDAAGQCFGKKVSYPMEIIASGKTDIGLRRGNNEDACLVRRELGLFTVADGIGGSAAGEIASRIFVESALEIFEKGAGREEVDISNLVQQSFRLGNERILAYSLENPYCQGMGCTAEIISFSGDAYVVGHVGDSRTYLLRDGELRQITKDHSLVQSQLEQGLITHESAKNHSLRNVVLRAVGIDSSMALDMVKGKTQPDDIFLLCSDGLTDMVEDSAIKEILSSSNRIDEMVDLLIECAKSAGGNDNITVVLCRVSPD